MSDRPVGIMSNGEVSEFAKIGTGANFIKAWFSGEKPEGAVATAPSISNQAIASGLQTLNS